MEDEAILSQQSNIMDEMLGQPMISELDSPLSLKIVYQDNILPGFLPGIDYLGVVE